MGLIVICVLIYAVVSVSNVFDRISGIFAPFMESNAGILLTVAVSAFVAYRWYRARHPE